MIYNELADVNFMIEPLILEVYLNKQDYKDRLLLTDLKKKAQIVKIADVDDTSFYVKTEEVEDILYTKYKKEILNFDSSTPSNIPSIANSIFFLESAMRQFSELRYFRVHVSNTEPIKSDAPKVFHYKIMHTKIDLVNKLTGEFHSECLRVFKAIGVYNPTFYNQCPYFECDIRSLFNKLNEYAIKFPSDSEERFLIKEIISIFGAKLEKDNSTALIIMQK